MSEFLRVQHGDDEVNEQQDGQNQCDCGYPIHALPQPLTRLDVEKRQAEENRCEKQHRQILHRNSLSFRARQLSKQLPLAMLRNNTAGLSVGMAEGFSKD
jgi:hypothetical protein